MLIQNYKTYILNIFFPSFSSVILAVGTLTLKILVNHNLLKTESHRNSANSRKRWSSNFQASNYSLVSRGRILLLTSTSTASRKLFIYQKFLLNVAPTQNSHQEKRSPFLRNHLSGSAQSDDLGWPRTPRCQWCFRTCRQVSTAKQLQRQNAVRDGQIPNWTATSVFRSLQGAFFANKLPLLNLVFMRISRYIIP